ncbi:hypothetical protein BKA69DRAFT_668735 [Paraphysoderma sedebokerense]|nr:hypothetical protein BKA69DRAFT_668735 [Paraphysoderma sedebokerense]
MFSLAFNIGMVFLPTIGYIDQTYRIKSTTSVGSFSHYTCFVLLICNILRIFFWLSKRFENVLLWQSIVMVGVQLMLLKVWLDVKWRPERSMGVLGPNVIGLGMSADEYLKNIWNWPHYNQYLVFLSGLFAILSFSHLLFGSSSFYGDILGFIGLGIESTVPLPQALHNHRSKSIKNFSMIIIATWLSGDLFKIWYFWAITAPSQFVWCGMIQCCIDWWIFIMYSKPLSRRRKMSDADTSPVQLTRV